MAELEIINGPLEVYWAPYGESFTAIGSSPAGNWALIGQSGSKNYEEDGVIIRCEKSLSYFRALGSPYPRKSFITEADVMVSVRLADFRLSQLRRMLNENTVTSDAGFDYLEFDIGADPTEIALLIRGTGKSPLSSGNNLQFNLNRVVEEGSQELAFVKGGPVIAELNFRVIYDDGVSYPMGRILQDDS